MKRKLKNTLPVLMITLALSGAMVATASASTGITLKPNTAVTFTGGTGGVKFETYGGARWELVCESGTTTGSIPAEQVTMTIAFTFRQCAVSAGGPRETCTTAGAEFGELRTGNLPARLVYLSKAKHEAAIDLNYEEPGSKTHLTFLNATCGGFRTKFAITKSELGKIAPVNTPTIGWTANFLGGSEYENTLGEKFPVSLLMEWGIGSYPAYLSADMPLKWSHAVEVIA